MINENKSEIDIFFLNWKNMFRFSLLFKMQRLRQELENETIKSREIDEQLRQIVDNGNEQRSHMDNVNTRVRDLRQKKSDLAAQKT